METIAVIQFATSVRYGYEGALSRAVSALLSHRLGHCEDIRASHVEIRPGDGSQSEDGSPGTVVRTRPASTAESDRLTCTERLDDEELTMILMGLRARHWLTGTLDIDEEDQFLRLDVELASVEGDVDPLEEEANTSPLVMKVWEESFQGELDEIAELLNQIALAVVGRLLGEEVRGALVPLLSVETRSFDAFRHYCAAIDAHESEDVREGLELACQEDPYFLEAWGEQVLEAALDGDQIRFEDVGGELLRAAHLRPRQLAAQLEKLELRGVGEAGLELALMALALNPGQLDLMRRVARLGLLVQSEQSQAALEALVEGGALDSEDVGMLALLSALYRLHGDEDRAGWAARQAVDAGKAHAGVSESYYALGALAMEIGDHVRASGWLEQVLEEVPEHIAARGDLAGAYMQQGRFDEAVHLLEAVPWRHVVLQSNLALALRHLGRLEEAEEAVRDAIELDPTHPQAWAVLGELCWLGGDLEEARFAFQTAVAVDPDNVFWHRELGRVLFHMGLHDQAMELFSQIMDSEPEVARGTPEILFVMAHMAEQEQGLEVAKSLLYKALELEPRFWQAANNLAVLLMREEHYDEAEVWLQLALEVVPDNEGILMNLERAGLRGDSHDG